MLQLRRCPFTIAVLCSMLLGCGGDRYPASQFRPIAIPEDAPSDVRLILDDLNVPDPLIRAHAARQLGEQAEAEEAVVNCLVDALQDENAMVRAAAAAALGRIGDRDAVAPLIAILRNTDEDRDVRSRVAESLGQLQAAEAVPDLITALNDTVWHVRLHAVDALGRIKHPEAVEALKNTARYDPDFDVRDAAREVLDQIGISPDEDEGVESNE